MAKINKRNRDYPECYGRADCLGCIWREGCEHKAELAGLAGTHKVPYRPYGATPPKGLGDDDIRRAK